MVRWHLRTNKKSSSKNRGPTHPNCICIQYTVSIYVYVYVYVYVNVCVCQITNHISILSSGSESMHAPTTRKHPHHSLWSSVLPWGSCWVEASRLCVLSVYVGLDTLPQWIINALFLTPSGSGSFSKLYRKEKVILRPHVISLHPFGPWLQSTLDLAPLGKKWLSLWFASFTSVIIRDPTIALIKNHVSYNYVMTQDRRGFSNSFGQGSIDTNATWLGLVYSSLTWSMVINVIIQLPSIMVHGL